jgi:hypothetical protein
MDHSGNFAIGQIDSLRIGQSEYFICSNKPIKTQHWKNEIHFQKVHSGTKVLMYYVQVCYRQIMYIDI